MASLALVGPALRHGGADAIKTWKSWDLTEPATNEASLEFGSIAWGKNLTKRAFVELVDHVAVAISSGLESIGLKRAVFGKGAHAHLRSPFRDDIHVASITGAACWCSRGSGWSIRLGAAPCSPGGCLFLLGLLGYSGLLLLWCSSSSWLITAVTAITAPISVGNNGRIGCDHSDLGLNSIVVVVVVAAVAVVVAVIFPLTPIPRCCDSRSCKSEERDSFDCIHLECVGLQTSKRPEVLCGRFVGSVEIGH